MTKRNWYGRLGLVLTVLMVGFAGVGMFWTPYEPTAMVGADRYATPSAATSWAGTSCPAPWRERAVP